jgi:integrase
MGRNKKLGNPAGNPGNNPAKGSSYFVEPIRDIADIQRIERSLRSEPRNHLLFVMGCENGLRVGDLLKLRAGQVRNLRTGDKLYIKEGKTEKRNFLGITGSVFQSLQNYLAAVQPDDGDFLFPSRKGKRALTTTAVNQMIKNWCRDYAKLSGRFGAHTLRKTWGYQKRMQGVSWEIICKRYRHSSQATTMRYLGIEDQEVEDSVLMRGVIVTK